MKRKYIRRVIGVAAIGGGAVLGWQFWGPGAEEVTQTEKRPFFIETVSYEQLQEQPTINKNGKIIGEQSITVTSQLNARVAGIAHQIGEIVGKDQLVIQLEDNSGSYTFNVQKAKTALDKAKISYETTMLSLDKAVTDAKHALEKAQNQYNSSSSDQEDSATSIQLDKAERELEKSRFDYQTKVKNDQQSISNYIATTKTLTNDIKILYDDVINEVDSLLGVTQLHKNSNDSFEDVLGARNTQTKRAAEKALREVLKDDEIVQQLPTQLPKDELVTHLETLKESTFALTDLLNKTDEMLKHTVTSMAFSASDVASSKSTISSLQTKVQTTASSLTQQINTIESFLATYRENQQSLAQSIEIAEQQRDLLVRNLRDSETTADISVASAQSAYETALKNRNTTRSSLQNAIEQAQISYNEAQKQLSKLNVQAPITGTIGQIMVDVGQEVSMGTPLFTMQSNEQPEIQVSLGKEELTYVQPGEKVRVTVNGENYTGTIGSIAQTAENNFTYQTIITLNRSVELLGSLAKVAIPIDIDHDLIPIGMVEIINKSTGELTLYRDGQLETVTVDLGKVRGSLIEIHTDIDPSTQVITSNTDTFDSTEFTLEIRQSENK